MIEPISTMIGFTGLDTITNQLRYNVLEQPIFGLSLIYPEEWLMHYPENDDKKGSTFQVSFSPNRESKQNVSFGDN